MRSLSCVVALVATSTSAAALDKLDYAVKNEHFVPPQWKAVGIPDAEHTIELNIGLKQSNFNELERHLYEVSDPAHSRYGQHLSRDDVDELIKPHNDTSSLVHEWLQSYGVEPALMTYSTAKDWIHINLPVKHVEKLLATQYQIYQHEDGSSQLVRAPGYSLPRHLHAHIDTVAPVNSFARSMPQILMSKRSALEKRDSLVMPHMNANGKGVQEWHDAPGVHTNAAVNNPTVQSACNFSAVTPNCLRTLYGTINYKPKSAGKNKVGIANYLMETQNRSDIALFLQRYRPDAVSAAYTFKIKTFQGGQNQQAPLSMMQLANGQDLEGNLDGDTILGTSYPTPLTSFNTGGMPPFMPDLVTPTNTNEPYMAFVTGIMGLNDAAIPQVISTSYGDDEQTVPQDYAMRVCQGFASLGARGVTLLFATGDSGVGSNGKCFSNTDTSKRMFLPAFSAGCPYITAVGGTTGYPETVAYDSRNGYSPGGGFSNYFKRPSYQNPVVPKYEASLHNEYKGLFNKHGRAYPDISAQSESFVVGYNGGFVLLDGTSAATPAAAGVLTLVNDALITAGKPVLGFMNPWLYKDGYKAFNDVTTGFNRGCNTDGFPAQTGWDAASGFGSPNFIKILESFGITPPK